MTFRCRALPVTSFTASGPFTVLASINSRIFFIEWMAFLAVGFSTLTGTVCQSPKSQAAKVELLIFRKNLSRFPAAGMSFPNSVLVQPSFFRPLANCLCFAAKCYANIAFTVIGLLLPSYPPAVFSRVIAVIVDAIECVAGWSGSHIFEKLRKAIPFGADFYATGSISGIGVVSGIVAAISHLYPNIMQCSVRHAVAFMGHAPMCFNGKGKSTCL